MLPPMDPLDYLLPIAIELAGVACVVHLWRRRERKHVALKIGWSVAVMLPLIGPLLYGAVYQALPAQAEVDRAPERSDYYP